MFLFSSATGVGADDRNLRWPKGASFQWCQAGVCPPALSPYQQSGMPWAFRHARRVVREKSHHWLAPACQAPWKLWVAKSGTGSRCYEHTTVSVQGPLGCHTVVEDPQLCAEKEHSVRAGRSGAGDSVTHFLIQTRGLETGLSKCLCASPVDQWSI